MPISPFLVGFTICLILFNPFLTSVIFPGTYASFFRFLLALPHSSQMLLKFSWYLSDPEVCAVVSFTLLFYFRTSFTSLTTRSSIAWPSDGRFLAPLNWTRPAPPLWTVNQVDFIALDCACITFQKFILWLVPYRGYTGRFLFLVLVFDSFFGSSSKVFTA